MLDFYFSGLTNLFNCDVSVCILAINTGLVVDLDANCFSILKCTASKGIVFKTNRNILCLIYNKRCCLFYVYVSDFEKIFENKIESTTYLLFSKEERIY